jgi:hypothetical protein
MLRGGLTVPVDPVVLLLDLERRGFRLWRDGDDIVLEPWSQLTEADRASLARWKAHVLSLLTYIPTVTVQ